jgi:hypothetical protein
MKKRTGKTRSVVITYEGPCRQSSGDYYLFDKARSAKSALALAAAHGAVDGATVCLPELWSDEEFDNHPYFVTVYQPAPWRKSCDCRCCVHY